MTGAWQVQEIPSSKYLDWVGESRSLFSSLEWSRVLRTLTAETLFAWNDSKRIGLLVPVFKRAGLRIGLLGFPQISAWPSSMDPVGLQIAARAIAAKARLHLVRFNLGLCEELDSRAVAARPELWIRDLSAWQTRESKRRRRDLAHARRNGCRISAGHIDSAECHRMYVETVQLRSGRVRYGEEYFAAISLLGRTDSRIQFQAGVGPDGRLLGFAVLAMDGDVACYLHGATNSEGKRCGISDLLLESIVETAAARGGKRFTLMASPWEQPGLISFKRKWADTEGLAQTFDCGLGVLGASAAKLTRLSSRNDRAAAARWLETRV